MLKWMRGAWANRGSWPVKQSAVSKIIAYHVLGQPVWTPRRYESLAEQGYKKNVIVYRCVNLIARGAASVPWRLYKGMHEVGEHALLDLLHHPNPRQAGASFIESVLAYLLLAGNSYVEMVKDSMGLPVELYALRPDRMRVIPGNTGVPEAFEYSVNGEKRVLSVDSIRGHSSVLHLKYFNPLHDWYGLSPIEAALSAIDQHNQVSGHNLALLQNGGRPSGALRVGPNQQNYTLTEDQREELRNSLRDLYEGGDNAGRILVMEGDMDWREMGLSPKDLDFVEGKNMSAREIAQAYGVPSMLVGVPGDATFSNYREARLHLWEDTILPLLDYLTDELNAWLARQYGDALRLSYDIDGIPALAVRRNEAWRKIQNVKFLTLNEKREAVGYAPLKDGDVLDFGNQMEEA